MALPLAGVRVLDMGQFWAGPTAGRAWAAAGAEVIKVESCHRPDPLRIQARGIYPDHDPGGASGDHWNRSGMVNERNRGKLGLAVDLQSERGRELFVELVKVSDAISYNFSRGVMSRLGLDYSTLSAVNPRIIMVAIMSQGLIGPESDYVSYGGNLEQLGGISFFSGYPDDPESSVGFALPDPLGGLTAALSLAAALRYRDLTGRGVEIDLSQREAATLIVGEAVVEYSMTGMDPARLGNRERGHVPSECYPCSGDDQWIAISVRDDQDWARLAVAIGQPELARDPRFTSVLGRRRNRQALDELLTSWTASQDKFAAMSLLQSHRVPAGAVMNPRELFRDPHLRGKDFWESVEDPSAGVQEYFGNPLRLSETTLPPLGPSPALGQHNRQLLRELLGLGDSEIADLEAEGVIGTRPLLTKEGAIGGRR